MKDFLIMLAKFWVGNYVENGVCVVCHNKGYFYSHDTGKKFYCFCPNGRGLDKHAKLPTIASVQVCRREK